MNDMSKVIVAKSDQLNSDDLVGGPITITIRDVKISGTEQPVSIFYDGDNGKPWKPCKSMARVMVAAWLADANKYIGRSLTLYRDPKVKWAGMEVGGIRISHMSHIERDMLLVLNETKGKKAAVTVKPLKEPARKADGPGADGTQASSPRFRLIKPDGQPFDFPNADTWRSKMFEWIDGLRRDNPEALKTFRAANGPIIAELVSAGHDQARAVDAKLTEATSE
jgi:hypothetical protein